MERVGSGGRVRDGEVVARTRQVPPVSLTGVLSAFDAPRTLWVAPDEPSVVGCGAAAVLSAGGGDRFRAIREGAEELFATGGRTGGPAVARPRLLGGFAFHDDHSPAGPWAGFGGARFVLPSVQVVRDDRTWLTVTAVDPDDEAALDERLSAAAETLTSLPDPGDPASPPGVTRRTRAVSVDAWRRGVESAVDRIRGGDLRKVVLAQALGVDLAGQLSVPDALDRLGAVYPDCYRFLVEPGPADDEGADPDARGDDGPGNQGDDGPEAPDGPDAPPGSTNGTADAVQSGDPVDGDGRAGGPSFFGATPERLVILRDRSVETAALAGSTGRGDTPEEDEWLATELAESRKDRHEHDLVVDAVRDQLAPFASSVGVGPRSVRRLANVQHLRTPITAELGDTEHVLSLVEALHPTPAVGGLPPDRALSTIRETEPFDRGWYAAPVGWFDAAGNGSFAVAIRSAVTRGRRATLFAGAGIVEDSDPDREWDEVQLKYRPILDVLE